MARPKRPPRVAVVLSRLSAQTPAVFAGILEHARPKRWQLLDEAGLADADGVLTDARPAAPPGVPTVTLSTGWMSAGDVRPDSARVHNLVAAHFADRGYRGFVLGHTALARLPRPAAVFETTDVHAVALVNAALSAGRAVPDDVAVLGFGDDVLTCERCAVPVSSVDINPRGIGRRAAVRLDRMLNGRPVDEADYVPPLGVVTRASTDVLAVADEDVALAVRFIRDHAAGPLRVGDVLRYVGIDRRTLERRFAKTMGRGPAEFIRRHRVETAATLLRTTDRPIGEIATATGFRLPQHLAAAFRQIYGQSPSDYRTLVPSPGMAGRGLG